MNPGDVFSKRILIEGLQDAVCFTFRILHKSDRIEYKVRTTNPDIDFNMQDRETGGYAIFEFCDETEIPQWIHHDKSAREKLSIAITNALDGGKMAAA